VTAENPTFFKLLSVDLR